MGKWAAEAEDRRQCRERRIIFHAPRGPDDRVETGICTLAERSPPMRSKLEGFPAPRLQRVGGGIGRSCRVAAGYGGHCEHFAFPRLPAGTNAAGGGSVHSHCRKSRRPGQRQLRGILPGRIRMGAMVGESGTKVRAGSRIDGAVFFLGKRTMDDIYFDPRRQEFRLSSANV